MDDWYFWYALSPKPSPSGFGTVEAYFDALIYRGGGQIPGAPAGTLWPSDRYSGFQSTESFNRFFGDGQTLGYGVAVAGIEVTEPTPQPAQPLYVRYIEPLSPAAAAGVVRGDRVMSINGVREFDRHQQQRLQRPDTECCRRPAHTGAAQCGRRRTRPC